MADARVCETCEDSGLVVPTPFDDDLVPWPQQVRCAAELIRRGRSWESSATANGLVKPVPCPDCGGVEVVPAAVMVRFEMVPVPAEGGVR